MEAEFRRMNRDNRRSPDDDGLGLLLAILVALGYGVKTAIERIDWDRIWALGSPSWVQVVSVSALAATAFGLFRLKQRHPKVYAILEFLVGLTTAWLAVSPSSASSAERGAKIAAATYLLVRARDNWSKKPEPREKLGHAVCTASRSWVRLTS